MSISSDMTLVHHNKKNWKVLNSSQRARAPVPPSLRTAPSQQYPATSFTKARVSASLPTQIHKSSPSAADIPSSPLRTNALDETFDGWPVSPPLTQTYTVHVPDSQDPEKASVKPDEPNDVIYDKHFQSAQSPTHDQELEHIQEIELDPERDEQGDKNQVDAYNMAAQTSSSLSAMKPGQSYGAGGAHNEQEQEQGHASEIMGDYVQRPEEEVTKVDVAQHKQHALPEKVDHHQERDTEVTIGAWETAPEQTHLPVRSEEAGKR
jgi:hypothetical protein